jgi:predicted GIY-YIG superfamily endonuclease
MVYIYILKLENKSGDKSDKYYIGKTTDPNRRLLEHNNSQGASWTKMYKPIETIKIIPNCDDFDEDKYTLEYMSKYGVDNVRGGSFCQVNLSKTHLETIQHMLNGSTDKCFECGNSGHFANACPNKIYDVYDINNPDYKSIYHFLKDSKEPRLYILSYIYTTTNRYLQDNIKISLTNEGDNIKQLYIKKFNDNETIYYLDKNELIIAFDDNYNFDENINYDIYKNKKLELLIGIRRFSYKILILKEDLDDYEYYNMITPDIKKEFIGRFYNTYSSDYYNKYLNHKLNKMFDNNYNFEENIDYEIYRQKKLQMLLCIRTMEERKKQTIETIIEPDKPKKIPPPVPPKPIQKTPSSIKI